MSIRAIAHAVGIHRKTVRSLLATPEPPCNKIQRPRPGGLRSPTLQPYGDYLQDRWQAGCTNVSQLCRELVALGYGGSRSLLAQAVQAWRPPRLPPKEREKAKRATRRLSMRWLCLRPPDQLKAEERALLDRLLAQDDDLMLGHALLQQFRQLVADRDISALDAWLADAKGSLLSTCIGLINGIEAERATVNAALLLPWSTGPVEGHINRVKLIKRQGYGRARFDLLRTRVLAG
jgi:transposase